jgi:hypothetical protein
MPVDALEDHLDSRAVRFPNTVKSRSSTEKVLAAWPPTAPVFVGSTGERRDRAGLASKGL